MTKKDDGHKKTEVPVKSVGGRGKQRGDGANKQQAAVPVK